MQLGITIPLQKYLSLKAPPRGPESDLFDCWELHTILLQGSRTLVGVNACNRFSVVLCNMTAGDWKVFPECFAAGLRAALSDEGFEEQRIEAYFLRAGESVITKTHGRSSVAGLNIMDDYLWAIPVPIDRDQLYQGLHTQEVNRQLCKAAGFAVRGYPAEFWERDMERVGI